MNIDEELELEIRREIYRESYYEFFKDAVKALEPETDWKFNWHIEEACNMFQEAIERVVKKEEKPYDLSFNLPPSSSKSMIFSICSVAWIWTFAPHIRYFTESHSFKLKVDHSRKTSTLIKSEWYQNLYGDRYTLTRSNDDLIENSKGGWRRSGIEIGMHADIGVGDDLIDSQNVSDAFVKQANDLWFKKVPSRFRSLKWGLKVLVMQRLSEGDPCGIVKERGLNYKHFIVPAILTKSLTPYDEFTHHYDNGNSTFWNDRFPMDAINQMQKTMSDSDFSSQYLQEAVSLDGGIIKKEWIVTVEPHQIVRDPVNEPVHFFLDTAYTDNHDNDPNAYLACFKRGDDLYIINVHEEWMGITKNIEYIKNYAQANGYSQSSVIFIEPKASGKDIVDIMRSQTNLNVAEAKNPVKDKVARLNAASPFIRSGRVIFVKGAYLDPFLNQLLKAPFAARWDMSDCLSMSIDELLMQSQFDFAFL